MVSSLILWVPADVVVERRRGFKFCKTAPECASGWSLPLRQSGSLAAELLSLLWLLLLPGNGHLFLHSLVPWRSLITETCSRAGLVTRLRSQNGFGPKWLLFCQESQASFFLRGPPALSAYI